MNIVVKSADRCNVHDIPISHGTIVYCNDTNHVFFDTSDNIRIELDNIVVLPLESDKASVIEPDEQTLYLIRETNKLYKYDTIWIECIVVKDILTHVNNYNTLNPITLTNNVKDPRFLTRYAPRTLATQVYTSFGESIEDKVNSITKVGMNTEIVISIKNQNEVVIPYPFDNYLETGNFFLLSIGGEIFSATKYSISSDNTKVILSTPIATAGVEILFTFIYNSMNPKSNSYSVIDGGYMTKKSIPTDRLKFTSDAYNLSDPTYIATSKALKNLYDVLSEKIDVIGGNVIVHITSTGTSSALTATVQNYNLVDMSTLYVRLHTDLNAGATLKINSEPAYPIYVEAMPVPAGSFKSGDIMVVIYSIVDHRFYISGGESYRIDTSTSNFIATGGEVLIPINIPTYNKVFDNLRVYQNNIRLFENINYVMADGKIQLKEYSADAGDYFVFESDKVLKIKI